MSEQSAVVNAAEPRQSTLRGAALMLSASVSFAAMGALVKHAGSANHPFVVVFVRSLVIALVVIGLGRWRGVALRVVNRRAMLVRCATGFGAMVCYFYGLSILPLSTAVAIQYLSPVFVALASRRAVGEPVTAAALLTILVAFSGVVLLVGPNPSALGPGVLLVLTSAWLSAFAYLAVRELRHTDSPDSIVAAFAWFAVVFSLPALAWADHWPSGEEVATLLGVGLTAYGGQILMTHAYRVARAAYVSALSYATVVLGAILGVLWFSERPSASDIAGMAVIAAAGVALSLLELRAEKNATRGAVVAPSRPLKGAKGE